MSNIDLAELYRRAEQARINAYAPFSGFRVGAALLTKHGRIYTGVNVLSEAVSASDAEDGSLERAMRYKDGVISAMNALREACDAAESVIPKGVWPLPSYTDILTSVK